MRRTSLVATAVALALAPAAAAAQTVAIEHATVWLDPGTKIDDGTVVIKGGTIAAAGKVATPSGARVIDASGKVVTAGLIDASTRLGLVEIGAVSQTREGDFADKKGDDIFASYRVADGYNGDSVAIPIARTGGVTAVVATPNGGFVAGVGGAFALVDGFRDSVARRDAALYVNLGAHSLESNDGARGIAVARLRQLFDDARRYRRSKAAYDRGQSRELAAGHLDLEAINLVLARRLPLVVRVDRASDIRATLALAASEKIDLVIEGGAEAWMLARELAAARVPVIVDPTSNLPSSFDRMHVRDDGVARLAAAGVPLILSTTGSASNVRNLRQRAGIAVGFGLTWEQALAAVTATPARAFGLKGRGALAPGNVADVVVWSGDPFEISSAPEHVFVAGSEVSLRTRQTRLLERYKTLPAKR